MWAASAEVDAVVQQVDELQGHVRGLAAALRNERRLRAVRSVPVDFIPFRLALAA